MEEPFEGLAKTLDKLRTKSEKELEEIEIQYITLPQGEDERIREITLSITYDRCECGELGINYNNVTKRDTHLLRLSLYLESRKASLGF